MMNRKIFGRKIFAFSLAVLLAFFQMPAAYSEGPTAPGETNPPLPGIPPGQGDQGDPQLPNPNDPNASGSGALSLAPGGGSGASAALLPSYVLTGDGNRDGIVDQADWEFWKANFGETGINAADYNGDGKVDAGDYVVWRKNNGRSLALELALIPNPLPGDGDRDGDVDQDDYNFMRANFGTTNPAADYNGDGNVDAADYVVWRKYNGRTIALLPGDYNGDGAVDAADYVVLRKTGQDINVWRANFGKTLVGEYRTVVQNNADALIDAIPPFYGPDEWSAVPPDIPGKIATFNSVMGDWEPKLLEVKNLLYGYTQHPQYNQLVSLELRTQVSDFFTYMNVNNETGFYGQWNSYRNFLMSFADYQTILANAKTVKMLQIMPPFYGSIGGGASVPVLENEEPTWIAKDNFIRGTNLSGDLWMILYGPGTTLEDSSEAGGGSGSAARAVSYSNPSDELRMAMLSNPGGQGDQNIENNLTNFIKPQRWLDRTKAKADAKKGRSNAKTKVKDELKTKNLVVVQKYLDQGKEVLATASETTVMLETASKSRI